MDRDEARKIEWDCSQLLLKFYGYLDEKRYDDLVALFAPDGAWVRLGKELAGPAAILEAMKEREDWMTAHLVSNIRVEIIGPDRADTTQYITLYRHEGFDAAAGPGPVVLPLGILRHKDQLVRMGGEWKFKRKTSRAMMVNRERVTIYDKPPVQSGTS